MASLSRAREYYQAGRYDDAIAELAALLQENSENEPAWRLLGACYFAQRDYVEAEYALRRCTTLAPSDPAVWINQGVLLRKVERWDEARRCLEYALYLDAESAHAREELQKVEALAAAPPAAPEQAPNSPPAASSRGVEAVEVTCERCGLRRPATLAGEPCPRCRQLGENVDRAIQALAKQADKFPGHLETQRVLVHAYQAGGQYDRAVRHAEQLAQSRPRDARALYLLGSAYLSAGRTREAKSAFEKVMHLQPEHAEARAGLQAAELQLRSAPAEAPQTAVENRDGQVVRRLKPRGAAE